jgi:hypothetical protein
MKMDELTSAYLHFPQTSLLIWLRSRLFLRDCAKSES